MNSNQNKPYTSGRSYFAQHFSDRPAAADQFDIKEAGDGLLLTTNQAVFIYDFAVPQLLYARGFEMLGFDDCDITIADIFNTAVDEHREACGEISGKALAAVQASPLDPLKNGIVLNYAGQTKTGEKMHLMLESAVYQLDDLGNFVSTIVYITKLTHLPVPKIVRWKVFGDIEEQLIEQVDGGLIQPNRISNRESEVLMALADGNTMAQIAAEFSISARTVEQHVFNMRERFECANIGQLVAFGKDMGLV